MGEGEIRCRPQMGPGTRRKAGLLGHGPAAGDG